MCGQCLLLFDKRYWWRRRRFLGNDLPACNCRRGRSHVASGRSLRPENAFARWSHSNSPTHRCRCDLLWTYLNSRLRHRLRAGERVLRNHHHRPLDAAICVGHIGDVRGVVNDSCVVDVGYLGDVHGRITDIDAIHIAFAHVIRGHINFPRTEREPAHVAAEAAGASANEHHQCRSIDSVHCHGTRHPSPAPADANPTAVVERSVAPRRVVDPSPSPG